MAEHLLLIALGPVQDFIMTARSSGDLWFGSHLLSECSKAAARAVAECENNAQALIFPAPKDTDELCINSSLNVANVILAQVQGVPQEVAENARAAIRQTIQTYWQGAQVPAEVRNVAAEQQIEDFIEFYWASTPHRGDYRAARQRVYALMAARKTTRNFAAVSWGSAAPKSSLDGVRESVIPESEYPKPGASRAQRQRIARQLFFRYGVRGGERLCAVGLLKRRAMHKNRPGFSSTSHIAVQPLLERPILDLEGARQRLEELKQLLGTDKLERVSGAEHPLLGDLDASVLLPERLREYVEDDQHFEQAKACVRDVLWSAYKVREAPVYYTLLHADGDRMGKVIDQLGSAEAHQEFSKKLSGFAARAKQIIEEHGGCTVFVGGDDVLAYLPLHRALKCATVLAKCFAKNLEDYKIQEQGVEHSPTLSAGLVIAHYLEPLQDVLEAARAAEKTAKKTRNALALSLLKRSGAPLTISGQWDALVARLQYFCRLHQQDLVPDGAAYELRQLASTLEPSEGAAAKAEAVRILRRKKAKQGTTKLESSVLDEIRSYIEENT
ncbi:MAG: type III-B CRISPR-associated protein Cas10/Cmr2, partial [Deinococcales bacterium]